MNNKNKSLEIYNIGNGEEMSIENISRFFSDYLNSKKIIKFDNIKNGGIPLNWKSDITKLKKYVGEHDFVRLDDGVKKTMNWFENKGTR